MNTKLEVIAHMTIRKGKLEGFRQQAAEIIRLAKNKDTKTIRYDWFLSNDNSECEVLEAYESSEGLMDHVMHIREARDQLFRDFADDHAVSIYGQPSPELVELVKAHKGVKVRWFSFLRGLAS